eukprot:12796-Heterococcus_DN1.PRE.1
MKIYDQIYDSRWYSISITLPRIRKNEVCTFLIEPAQLLRPKHNNSSSNNTHSSSQLRAALAAYRTQWKRSSAHSVRGPLYYKQQHSACADVNL